MPSADQKMDAIVSLCKRRGFVFPSSEIYGGFAAVYDYGPYGVELKNNIRDAWWKHMVHHRPDVVGLDSAIFMHPMTWKASGHLDSFDDPQLDCRTCKNRMRADLVLEKFGVDADKMPIDEMNELIQKLKSEGKIIKCEKCGGTDITPAKKFSLMVKSNLGSPTTDLDEATVTYLRAETCQGIYLNYKNVMDSTRVKLPFGIAQIGKAFRNEIVARQFIFRTREFEQMEMQYFLRPAEMDAKFDEWKDVRWNWYVHYGIKPEHLQWYKHIKLAHYASDAYDIQYNFDAMGGFKEIEGIHKRGDWDLTQHAKFSGERLDYLDEQTGARFVPHIMETSAGLNRCFLAFLYEAYHEEQVDEGDTRIVLKFDPRLAPVKAAIMPLQKKDGLAEIAKDLANQIRKADIVCEYDESGSIGKRYRRQDEIGTPWCFTVDYTTKDDQTVTVRDRDQMSQERVAIKDVPGWLADRLK